MRAGGPRVGEGLGGIAAFQRDDSRSAGLGQIVAHASAARHQLAERTGHRIDGLPEGIETLDRYQPAARAELFEHYQEIADPDRFLRQLAERDPASLSPAEKVTLERAYSLVRRMGSPNS